MGIIDHPACEKCEMHRRPGDECCRIVSIHWNVSKAKRLVSDGRTPIAQPVDVLKAAFSREEQLPTGEIVTLLGFYVHAEHVAHVDPDSPGIAAFALDSYILIDGHHRVARCLQLGRPTFDVYFLTKKESDAVLTSVSRRRLNSIRQSVARREKERRLSVESAAARG